MPGASRLHVQDCSKSANPCFQRRPMMNVAPETPLRGRQMPMDDGETPPPVCPFWTQATQAANFGSAGSAGRRSESDRAGLSNYLELVPSDGISLDIYIYIWIYDYMTYVCICICVPAWICMRQSFDLSFHGTAFGWEHGHTDIPPGRDPLPNEFLLFPFHGTHGIRSKCCHALMAVQANSENNFVPFQMLGAYLLYQMPKLFALLTLLSILSRVWLDLFWVKWFQQIKHIVQTLPQRVKPGLV